MIDLLPAILAESHAEFEQRLRFAETFAPVVHVDVLDGTLYPHMSWADPRAIGAMATNVRYEIHLMVENPVGVAEAWREYVPNVARAIFHAEIDRQHEPITERLRQIGFEVGLALNPETPLSEAHHDITLIDELLLMTVHPGAMAQGIGDREHGLTEMDILAKVTDIHERYPHLILGVDGGITPANIRAFGTAGATRCCIGSALFLVANPQAALADFRAATAL